MAIGEQEDALDYLEQAIVEGGNVADVHYYSAHPEFSDLRNNPRFRELVKRAGMARSDFLLDRSVQLDLGLIE